MAIFLGTWGRNYDEQGNMTAFPANAWEVYRALLPELSPWFDGLQLPPAALTQSGTAPDGDGYGTFEFRNLDGTYWGNKESLMALIAAAHAYGMKVYGDFPFRQMDGENGGPGVFKYDGRRGETTASCFQYFGQPGETMPPFVAQDDIPDTNGDWPDGRIRSLQNSVPAGYIEADTKDILQGYVKQIAYDGGRIDEAKAQHAPSIARIAQSVPMTLYAEFDDGNPQNVYNYACEAPMNGCVGVEDYPGYWHFQTACNSFDATQLESSGFFGFFSWRPDLAIGFLGNPDVTSSRGADGGISEQIAFNLGIGYALLLNLPMRTAMVDAQHYFPASETFPNGFGLKPIIDNLCWIARTFSFGAFECRWVDKDVYAYTRDGDGGAVGWSGGLLVAVNFNVLSPRTITVGTTFGPNRQIHDYTGHAPDVWTDMWGSATITIPSNAYSSGESYCCYAPAGVDQPYPMTPMRTTQVFEGAVDLDVKVVKNGVQVLPQRIYCAKETTVSLEFSAATLLLLGQGVLASLLDSNGGTISSHLMTATLDRRFADEVPATGWYTIQLTGKGLPEAGSPFTLAVTYEGAV